MKTWQGALSKFLGDWQKRKEILGAIVTGSYAIGVVTKYSDIDVHIILSDDVNWTERGNKIVDGFLIEYFANPIRNLKKSLEEDYKNRTKHDARMFTIGKIMFDKTGVARRLKENAKREMIRSFKKPNNFRAELAKYRLWDQLDNLKDLNYHKSSNFKFLYYLHLDKILSSYAEFLGKEVVNPAKLEKWLFSAEFRKKYNIPKFPDKKFVELFGICLRVESFTQIKKLTEYVLEKMGGFNIDGWKLRTKLLI